MLPAAEIDRLELMKAEGAIEDYQLIPENGMTCVVLAGFRLRAGLTVHATDLLLRLPPGFPDAAPDMFWCSPTVMRADGVAIPQADVFESHLGRTWQRFSRHLTAGEWQPGVDSLDSFIALIRKTLYEGIAKAA